MIPARAWRRTASGDGDGLVFDSGQDRDIILLGIQILAGAAPGSVTLTEQTAGGRIVWQGAILAGTSVSFNVPIAFRRSLYVTFTGSNTVVIVYV